MEEIEKKEEESLESNDQNSNESMVEKEQETLESSLKLDDENEPESSEENFEIKPALPTETPTKVITESTATEIENEFEESETESREKVEASLFIAGRFLNLEELIMLTDINPIMLKGILHDLSKKYDGKSTVLRLVHRNGAYKLDVAEKYHYLINKLATGTTEFTKAEQGTLAIIAYKQPVKQSVVIKIRGNKSYDHIKKFRDLGLVVAKKVGHTLELSLSEEFYEYFNVHNKENNPEQNSTETN